MTKIQRAELPKSKVYVIDLSRTDFDFREAERKRNEELIVAEAERLGSVYSLDYFQECVNNEELNLNNSFILIK